MTAGEVVTLARERYPDMTDARGLELLNAVLRTIATVVDVNRDAFSTGVTASQAVYALPSDFVRAYKCEHTATSGGEPRPLTHMATLESVRRRMDMSKEGSSPTYWLLEPSASGVMSLRLWPVPDTSHTGGVPGVTVTYVSSPELDTGDPVPSWIPSHVALARGVMAAWSSFRDEDSSPMAEALFLRDMQAMISLRAGASAADPVKMVYVGPRRGRGKV